MIKALFLDFRKNWVKVLSIFVSVSLLAGWQAVFPHTFGDPDGWYHLGMAKLYETHGVSAEFPWLAYTTLKEHFFDQQHLYHLLLSLSPTVWWAKTLQVLAGTLLLFALQKILQKFNIRVNILILLLFLCLSSGFLYRLGLVKGGLFGTALFFWSIYTLLSKKYFWLFPISLLWLLLHGSFVLLAPLLASYIVFNYKSVQFNDFAHMLFYTVLGLAAGLLLHPQSQEVLGFLQVQLQVPLGGKHQIVVGNEWYGYSLQKLYTLSFPLAGFWAIALGYWLKSLKGRIRAVLERDTELVWLWSTSVFFFLFTLSSQRFVEFFAPLAALTVTTQIFSKKELITLNLLKELLKTYWHFATSVLILLMVVCYSFFTNITHAGKELLYSQDASLYEKAIKDIQNQSPKNALIFNTQWDQFPQLFYWNQKNYYVVGLDPLFMYEYDEALYWKWRKITDEDSSAWNRDTVYLTIKNDFGAKYIFLENFRNPKLLEYLKDQPQDFTLGIQDDYTTVFRVN